MDNSTKELNLQIKGKIIINADDFGYDESHTMGILKAFEVGLISNATVMVNMPHFDEACVLSEEYGVKDRIGLHLNLVEGIPLTEGIKQCSTFCDANGIMHGLWRRSIWKTTFLTKKERELLKQEIVAQFSLFEQKGFPLRHFDTHGHAHTYFSVWNVIVSVLKARREPYQVRIAKNLFDRNAYGLRALYKKAMNFVIPHKMHCSDFFTDVKGYLHNALLLNEDSVTEIMCHPCLVDGMIFNPDDLQITELKQHRPQWEISRF